jgi:hypothetical protein
MEQRLASPDLRRIIFNNIVGQVITLHRYEHPFHKFTLQYDDWVEIIDGKYWIMTDSLTASVKEIYGEKCIKNFMAEHPQNEISRADL